MSLMRGRQGKCERQGNYGRSNMLGVLGLMPWQLTLPGNHTTDKLHIKRSTLLFTAAKGLPCCNSCTS